MKRLFLALFAGTSIGTTLLNTTNEVSKINTNSINIKEKNNKIAYHDNDLLEMFEKSAELFISSFLKDNPDIDINNNDPENIKDVQDRMLAYYSDITSNKLMYAYEDKIEYKWYWVVYWRWYVTWDGLWATLHNGLGIHTDAVETGLGAGALGALKIALLKYLGIAKIPFVGWIIAGYAAVLAATIVGIISDSKLWDHPRGIVMAFTGVAYSGWWYQ